MTESEHLAASTLTLDPTIDATCQSAKALAAMLSVAIARVRRIDRDAARLRAIAEDTNTPLHPYDEAIGMERIGCKAEGAMGDVVRAIEGMLSTIEYV